MISFNLKQVLWSGCEKFASSGLHFLFTLFLARLLTPSDYGVVAVLGIFIAISQSFIDGGLTSALIQKKSCTEVDYSTVFYTNIVFSFICYFILFLSAPFIAEFFSNSALVAVIRVYSLSLIINSFGLVHNCIISKKLQFSKFAKVSIFSSIISGVIAVILAKLGFGYWSLVAQTLISCTINTLCYLIYSSWNPQFSFSFKVLFTLLPYSLNILCTSLLSALYNNLYSIIIGRCFSSNELGLYNRAYSLNFFLPQSCSDFVMKAMFPIQSKVQDNKILLKSQNTMALHTILFLLLPVTAFVFFNTDDIIVFLLTDKWLPMAPFARILSLSCLSYVFCNLYLNILKVSGKSKYVLYSELLKKAIGIAIVMFTLHWGLNVMVYGLLVSSIIDILIGTHYVNKVLDFTLFYQLKNVILIYLSSFLVFGLFSFFFSFIPVLFLRLLVVGFLSLLSYLILMYILKDNSLMYFLKTITKH